VRAHAGGDHRPAHSVRDRPAERVSDGPAARRPVTGRRHGAGAGQASQSRADATSFVLMLANPGSGVFLSVSGGAAARRPSSPAVQAVTVRGQQGSVYTTGAGYTVFWMEGSQPYELIANGRTLQAVLDLAFRLQTMDVQSWRQRVGTA
jgi:hypothetical protein